MSMAKGKGNKGGGRKRRRFFPFEELINLCEIRSKNPHVIVLLFDSGDTQGGGKKSPAPESGSSSTLGVSGRKERKKMKGKRSRPSYSHP